MRLGVKALAVLLAIIAWSTAAEARHARGGYHGHSHHHRSYRSDRSDDFDFDVAGSRHSVGARPSQWCGWWMRTQKGGGPEYNLAWNWSKWGRPSGPQVGAVVVWRHHVGEITGRASDGRWIVKSGNDGHAVRERPRSVAGAVFRVG